MPCPKTETSRACSAADGAIVWQRNILQDFKGRNINWLISESPLVDGDRVIVSPGGRDATVVALDKMTGKTIWTSKGLSDDAGYASAIVADIGGVRTLMTFTAEAGVGIRASDGKLMWRHPGAANRTANIATPVFSNGKVFYTSGYDTGGALLKLTAQGGEVKAAEAYFTRDMKNHHGGVVLVDGYLYGFNDAILTAIKFETGKMAWRDRSVGKGSLTYADGHLYILGEGNTSDLSRRRLPGTAKRDTFRFPTAGCRRGLTLSSAEAVYTFETRVPSPPTISRRSKAGTGLPLFTVQSVDLSFLSHC